MATLIVDSLADTVDATDSVTTLREALIIANGDTVADRIEFATAGRILLTGTELTISSDVVIDGGGTVVIDANFDSRVLTIASGTSTLEGLSITSGATDGYPYSGFPSGGGIEIHTGANLSVVNSSLYDNSSGYYGGAIYNNGTLSIVDSQFTNNSASLAGGAIYSNDAISISNSTFEYNSASANGGGIRIFGSNQPVTFTNITMTNQSGGAISARGDLTLVNATITSNNSFISTFSGGVTVSSYGSLTLINSLILGNNSEASGTDANIEGTYTSTGSIIGGDATLIFEDTQDVDGNGLMGGALNYDGGALPTVALLADTSNPALDIGTNPAGGPITDARGEARESDFNGVDNGGLVDAGAFELQQDPDMVIVGTPEMDNLVGGNGNDTISGLAGMDNIIGGSGDDVLSGGPGDDNILGKAGDDILDGGEGLGNLLGGAGDDTLIGGSERDTLVGGDGTDLVDYASSVIAVVARLSSDEFGTPQAPRSDNIIEVENLRGSDFDDILTGSELANRIVGGRGDDIISGGAGNDTLNGNLGDDVLDGGLGSDLLNGGGGRRDIVSYASATERVTALLNSTLGASTDAAAGDRYIGVEGLIGTDFDDALGGDTGDNFLYGGDGLDFLFGDAGADVLDGGASDGDAAFYINAIDGQRVDLRFQDTNTGTAEGDVLIDVESLFGSERNDDLRGDAKANGLVGLDGDDLLVGRQGDDIIRGFNGDDVLLGGAGADILSGGDGIDRVQYSDATAGVIVDLISQSRNTGYAAGDMIDTVEDVRGSRFDDELSGNFARNGLDGGDGDDRLFGKFNDDTLNGGAGDDVLLGGAGGDALIGGSGFDRAQYSDADAGVVADLRYTQRNTGDAAGDTFAQIEALQGSSFADSLRGDGFDNLIVGLAGNDFLFGRNGDDRLIGGDGDDVLDGGNGADILNGGAGFDRADYVKAVSGVKADLQAAQFNNGMAAGDDYRSVEALRGGQAGDDLRGNAEGNALEGLGGDDYLTGRRGDDVLRGGAGDDFLNGGRGADTLVGGSGNDTFRFNAPVDGGDTILDFQIGRDVVQLDDAGFDSLTPGVVSADNFAIGSASDADDYLIYDSGALFYDADGNGAEAAVLIASFANGAALDAEDILIV